ncbi:MAG: hypothetical protein ABSG53_23815 [Thermoguttaceae bacterium]
MLAAARIAAGLPVTTLDGAPGLHQRAPGRRKAGETLGNPGKFFRDRFEDWVAGKRFIETIAVAIIAAAKPDKMSGIDGLIRQA